MMMTKAPKKLIEVALPLDDINAAAAREKSIRHGHPSTLHLWWARRPLAAARAVLFAQLVNDPGGERGWGKYPGQTKEDAQKERERLFAIIRELVKWENTNNEELLEVAREEIRKSWRETCELNKGKPGFDPDKLPAFHDPFAGGGAIPLEAQRLGLEAYASDLNPVAVMINKAMIEIPPKFAGKAPVGPIPDGEQADNRGVGGWTGARGLAEDVRRYGHWMRKEAEKRIGHLYPKVKITPEMAKERPDLKGYVGRELTVIAWLGARTVKCPNPACGCSMPLLGTLILSSKKGKEAYLLPCVYDNKVHFTVVKEKPSIGIDLDRGYKRGISGIFECACCGYTTTRNYVAEQGVNNNIGFMPTAIVLEGNRERIYVENTFNTPEIETASINTSGLDAQLSPNPRDVWCRNFGLNRPIDLFTPRQIVALTTFSDLVREARDQVIKDAKNMGWYDDGIAFDKGGMESTAYGDAVAVYLTLALNKIADRGSVLCGWDRGYQKIGNTFGRQAIPMKWDFVESNFFSGSTGSIEGAFEFTAKAIPAISRSQIGLSSQHNASGQDISSGKVISTDPPYYDNIGYADLSDFFYVWIRRALKPYFADLFSTISVPKAEELIAAPYRHGGKELAEHFFMSGMQQTMANLAERSHQAFPTTIYYAFKQADTKNTGTSSTGWESFLEAVIQSGYLIAGTWPMRTEYTGNLKKSVNALASSIVLVCRKRDENAPSIPRRQFLRELKEELPEALEAMIGGKKGASPIAPVDLAQAAIGPGMAVFSRYSGVIEADGSKMTVHDALIQINKVIDEFFNEAEGDMDSDTRFCIDWFMQYGFKQAEYGQADVLARAKGTTVEGLAAAGVAESGGGKMRLLKFEEYPGNWDPERDTRTPAWEALHQLIRALRSGGEAEAGALLKKMAERTESIRQLAYRLYTLCERKGWAEEARAYNELIASWHGTMEAAEQAHATSRAARQLTLDM